MHDTKALDFIVGAVCFIAAWVSSPVDHLGFTFLIAVGGTVVGTYVAAFIAALLIIASRGNNARDT